MTKIIRTEPGSILSKAVEYHGFVYLPGITARDSSEHRAGTCLNELSVCQSSLPRLNSSRLSAADMTRPSESRLEMSAISR